LILIFQIIIYLKNIENENDKWDLLNKKRNKIDNQKELNNSTKKLKVLNEQSNYKAVPNKNLIDDYSDSEEENKGKNT